MIIKPPNPEHASIRPLKEFSSPVAKIRFDNGISFTINESSMPLLIGRSAGCDICIPTANVSRKHCELYLDDMELRLRDISTNGTLVGSRRLIRESIPIQRPIRIHLAEYSMMTVTPCAVHDGIDQDRTRISPRKKERRHSTRRTDVFQVDFEQRSGDPRRTRLRRSMNHHPTSPAD